MNTLLKAAMKGKGSKVKVESRYTELSSKRNAYLSKAEAYSKFTLPNIFPTEQSGTTETQHGFDSTGAKVTNHLVNKLVQTLFPAHLPFFRLEFSEEGRNALKEGGVSPEKLQELLAAASAKGKTIQSNNQSRKAFIEALKHLIIGGNSLIYAPVGRKVSAIPLSNYVVDRDSSGDCIEIITEQTKNVYSFSEELQPLLLSAMKAKGLGKKKEDMEITLYTWVYRKDSETYAVAQTAFDIMLQELQYVPKEELPWIPLAWNLAYGRDYGNGYVEDYSGDMYALEFLTEAETKGLVLMADIKYMLKAGSITKPSDIFGTETGEVITGNIEDVGVLQLEKYANFEYIAHAVDKLQRQISQAFLMGQGSRREGERVTAYEVSLDAQEQESSLGGQYTIFKDTWQAPYAKLLMLEIGLELPEGVIEPEILTGLDAFARTGDLELLRQYSEALGMTNTWPEPVLADTNFNRLSNFIATSIGLEMTWAKTDEEKAAEAEAAKQAEQEQMLAQEGAKAAPDLIKEMTGVNE